MIRQCSTETPQTDHLTMTKSVNKPVDGGEKESFLMPNITRNLENGQIYEDPSADNMLYSIDDVPPWHTATLLGLQHFLVMFVGQIAQATLISDALGFGEDIQSRGQLISTILTMAAFATVLQTTLGSRLPIVQGISASFLLPLIAISALPKWDTLGTDNCTEGRLVNVSYLEPREENMLYDNVSASLNVTDCHNTRLWKIKLREAQGALISAAFVNIIIGYSGILGLILPYVRHLTIAVVITMIALPLAGLGITLSAQSWPIAVSTVVTATIFGQYLENIKIPIPAFAIREKRCEMRRSAVFSAYPVLLAMVLMWAVCAILTAGGALQSESPWKQAVRTDTKLKAVRDAAWIRFPLPFQWGMPSFSVSGFIGMIFGVIASTIESIGDYYTCARLSGAPKPPVHAMNRGIGTEGLANLLCGIWGTGAGVTSYTGNVGIIALTKVGSRRVVQFAALWMLLSGLLSKLGALFATVPRPIIGGVYLYIVGFMISAGLSGIQFVNLSRTRNMYILGMSLALGVYVPSWIKTNPGVISTGNTTLDQTISVMLNSTMFVGGAIAMFLDNTIPDPDRQSKAQSIEEEDTDVITYDLPCGMRWIRRVKCLEYLPCSPTFTGFLKRNRQ